MPHMYVLKCADASYYVGSTRDLETRFFLHNDGRGAEYTRHRLPVELAFAHETDTIEEAFALEKQVQGWSRAKREALIRGDWSVLPALSKKNFHRKTPVVDDFDTRRSFLASLLNQRGWAARASILGGCSRQKFAFRSPFRSLPSSR